MQDLGTGLKLLSKLGVTAADLHTSTATAGTTMPFTAENHHALLVLNPEDANTMATKSSTPC
eukprot:8111960-Ditylum_brightwellii.AAC.1